MGIYGPSPGTAAAGQWGIPGMQVTAGQLSSRPFSPLPGYNGASVGWYAGGMGWPGMM